MNKRLSLIVDFSIIFLIIVDLIIVVYYTIYPFYIPFNILIFDLIVVLILIVEFMFRFRQAENKRKFMRSNGLELLGMVPLITEYYIPEFALLGLFRFIRFIRLFRLLRVVGLFKKSQRIFKDFLRKTNMDYAIIIFLFVLITGAFSLYLIETNTNPNVNSLDDAFWYVIVTITTVGYGDISPQTEMGRIIGIIIMFTGIGFMSLLTASIATFFVNRHKSKDEIIIEEKLEHIEEQMNNKFNEMQSEINSLKEIIKKR
jgi:voltage-gated potassium channel